MKKRILFASIAFVMLVIALGFTHSINAQAAPSSKKSIPNAAGVSSLPFNGWLAFGNTGGVSTVSSAEIDLPNTSSYTIETYYKLSDAWGYATTTTNLLVIPFFFKDHGNGMQISETCSGTVLHRTCNYSVDICGATAKSSTATYCPSDTFIPSTYLYVNVWHHIALVNDAVAQQIRIYLDGHLVDSRNNTLSLTGSENSLVGCYTSSSCPTGQWAGQMLSAMDELRISNVVRYDANFAPPAAPFTCDNATFDLWHFDELEGAAKFHNSCGTDDNFLTGISSAHTEGISGSWVYLPLVVR